MSETTPARLPGLPAVTTGNAAQDRWIQAVNEILDVREGRRGSDLERVVTWRDMRDAGFAMSTAQSRGAVPNGVMVQTSGGQTAVIPMDAFAEAIRKTRLYQDLLKRLDDPTRFDTS